MCEVYIIYLVCATMQHVHDVRIRCACARMQHVHVLECNMCMMCVSDVYALYWLVLERRNTYYY